MKLAAIEAEWETQKAPASFTVFGIPNDKEERTDFQVLVPWALGLIATRSVDKEVTGIKDLKKEHEARIRNGMVAYEALVKLKAGDRSENALQAFEQTKSDLGFGLLLKKYTPDVVNATPEQIQAAVRDTIPKVAPLFWGFRAMVGLGFFMLFIFVASFWFMASKAACAAALAAQAGAVVDSRALDRERTGLVRRRIRPAALDHLRACCRPTCRPHRWKPGRSISASRASSSSTRCCWWSRLFLMFKYARLGPSSLHTRSLLPRAVRHAAAGSATDMILDYETLKVIWWLFVGVLLIGFALTDGFDMGVGDATAIRRPHRRRAPRRDQHHRPDLGRQPGVVHYRRRRHLRRLAAGLRGGVLGLLRGADADAVCPVPRPVGFDYRSKIRRSALALDSGTGACSSAARCLLSSSASPSATCCRACHFSTTTACASPIRGSFFGLLNPFGLLAGVLSLAMLVDARRRLPAIAHRRRHPGTCAALHAGRRSPDAGAVRCWLAFGWPRRSAVTASRRCLRRGA